MTTDQTPTTEQLAGHAWRDAIRTTRSTDWDTAADRLQELAEEARAAGHWALEGAALELRAQAVNSAAMARTWEEREAAR